jgi:hypothetical protein
MKKEGISLLAEFTYAFIATAVATTTLVLVAAAANAIIR